MLFALLPLAISLQAQAPVPVTLHDANHGDTFTVVIGRDGTIDADAETQLEHAFRCKRSEKEHAIDPGLLSMIAAVQAHWPDMTLEYISAYRGWSGQRKTSRHAHGRAFDFRIPGVKLTELRDFVWTHFSEVGVGWYPTKDFVHMDHRDGFPDTAWTWTRGTNHYHPSWAARVREDHPLDQNVSDPPST
jgi:uncharacterized protein YcbK (DUF882 family)